MSSLSVVSKELEDLCFFGNSGEKSALLEETMPGKNHGGFIHTVLEHSNYMASKKILIREKLHAEQDSTAKMSLVFCGTRF